MHTRSPQGLRIKIRSGGCHLKCLGYILSKQEEIALRN